MPLGLGILDLSALVGDAVFIGHGHALTSKMARNKKKLALMIVKKADIGSY
jgi:hypothetical protein